MPPSIKIKYSNENHHDTEALCSVRLSKMRSVMSCTWKKGGNLRCIQCHLVDMTLDAPKIDQLSNSSLFPSPGDEMTCSQASFSGDAPFSTWLSLRWTGQKNLPSSQPISRRRDSIDSTCHLSRAHSSRVMSTGERAILLWKVRS